MSVKERLHRLVDELPEEDVRTAERILVALRATADPLLRALLAAPEEDEVITPEEEAAVREARDALAGGEPTISDEELRRELGI